MTEEMLLEILKEYYSQGDDYCFGETETYYYAFYVNDYPMQHGYGIEIRYYKQNKKLRAYRNGYRYRFAESQLNKILCKKI